MWCEECYGVMGMSRNVDGCPAGSAAGSAGHNAKIWYSQIVTDKIPWFLQEEDQLEAILEQINKINKVPLQQAHLRKRSW